MVVRDRRNAAGLIADPQSRNVTGCRVVGHIAGTRWWCHTVFRCVYPRYHDHGSSDGGGGGGGVFSLLGER